MTFDPKRIENAIKGYHRRQDQGSSRQPRRKNKTPEKDVEKAVLEWARDNNIFLHVIEASSWDPRLGRKGSAKAQTGFPDLVGNSSDGLSLYVELKAKDRRSTLSEVQRLFLTRKIEQGCFAVCVDSPLKLDQYLRKFLSLANTDLRRSYLIDCLPKRMSSRKPPKDDEFGF